MIGFNSQHILKYFRITNQLKKYHKEHQRIWKINNQEKCNSDFRKRYKANPNLFRMKGAKQWKKIKLKVFNFYSNNKICCNCCGESHIEFLDLDHIDNNGAEHRKKLGGQASVYYWIVRNNYPNGFQLLCKNCNMYKARDPKHICIHQKYTSKNIIGCTNIL